MLELEALKKSYGDVVALDGCSFRVDPGRVLGFLGRNGSGKTTAMRAIFGLIRLDDGRVLWDGRPIGHEERLRFGYMPEERGLYPKMPALEQVAYFGRLHGLDRSAAGRSARGWLERLGLGDRLEANIDTLSHGNQQRVQLAAALVATPDLLVLDEPFSGLDPVAAVTLSEVIRDEAGRGAAVVFSSHQLDMVEDVCDDVAIITRGHVVLGGNLREIRRGSPHRYVQLSTPHGGTAADWPARIPGASVSWSQDGAVRLRVPASAGIEALLPAITGAGPIESLSIEPPSLTDIFLEAVAE